MMLQNFIDYLEARARIRAAYVWGGQGERGLTDAQIRRMESTEVNAQRVIKYRNKLIAEGMAPDAIEYYDCSGLGVRNLKDILRVLSYDTTADGLMGFCSPLKRDELRRGDWVFRVYASGAKKGRAYHIGYIVDDALNVVEAKGRDDGVVKRPIDASGAAYWNAYGRPSFFKAEIESAAATPATAAPAPQEKPCPYDEPVKEYKRGTYFSGNDAKWYKWHLNRIGYKFDLSLQVGPKTWEALNYEIKQARQSSANTAFRQYLKSVPTRQ